MILSMTGFAAVGAELPGVALAVELRSVNHRFLDLQVRLPDELRGLETTLREQILAELKRGKVECRVSLTRSAADATGLAVDLARAAQLAKAAADVTKVIRDARPLSVGEILPLAGRAGRADRRPRTSSRRMPAGSLARRLPSSLPRAPAKARSSSPCWSSGCDAIEQEVARVAPRIPAIQAAYAEKLGARLREAGLDSDGDRLKQELALFATKVDVAEELSRLSTISSEVRRVLTAGGSAGKRLDFLMQELHREANTLGSKSVDAELSQSSLEMKVLIEQMREQVKSNTRKMPRACPLEAATVIRGPPRVSRRLPHRRCVGVPVRAGSALGRRQDEPRRGAPGARAGIRPFISYTTRAPLLAKPTASTITYRRAPVSRSQGQGRVPRARLRPRQLVRDVSTWLAGEVARGHDVAARNRLAGRSRVRRLMPEAVHIFILPPTLAQLRERLEKRGQDAPEVIHLRLEAAQEEMRHCGDFDYVIMNQDFARAVDDLSAIVRAARLTAPRQMVRHSQLLQRLLEH
jgi:uncharacterized protein YicC (UPF0701 family)